jgi:hypothetical protein
VREAEALHGVEHRVERQLAEREALDAHREAAVGERVLVSRVREGRSGDQARRRPGGASYDEFTA